MTIPPLRRAMLAAVALGVVLSALTLTRPPSAQATPAIAAASDASIPGIPAPTIDLDDLATRAACTLTESLRRVELPVLLGLSRHGIPTHRDAIARGGFRRPVRRGVLAEYVERMRGIAPYAQITSTFYEPRPGRLHNGYDIGLDYGTPVPVGWAGRVTKITDWYGGETGITVETNGIDVTYGHLAPDVKVGAELQPGDIVGHIIRDHVDIKMYCHAGYIDYAKVDPFVDPVLTELHLGKAAHLSAEAFQAARPEPRVTYSEQGRPR